MQRGLQTSLHKPTSGEPCLAFSKGYHFPLAHPRRLPLSQPEAKMISVMPQPAHQPALHPAHLPLHVDEHEPRDVEFNELGDLKEALEPFAQLIRKSGHSVRLYCTIPTACPSSSCECYDLHDLHDLRTRSLLFVHNLVETLRASGIPASYRLQPSNCHFCLICALPNGLDTCRMKAAAVAAVENAHFECREKALLADLQDGLALIIT
ncbi:hypothetical protein DAEQUDRAFT_731767 [Daedalea quercina L-15889]|uniref:Uncharacterized protein n=1 Tax=Daedalea quercina L-15889 TaxID=1314783 RepID=A0A165M1Z2_9APHY|nr:hypothetical protein DAEQUDRAFT_731767 [Daedalea quercina L-15889]